MAARFALLANAGEPLDVPDAERPDLGGDEDGEAPMHSLLAWQPASPKAGKGHTPIFLKISRADAALDDIPY